MEEVLHEVPQYCEFALLDSALGRWPDESNILRFRTAQAKPTAHAVGGRC